MLFEDNRLDVGFVDDHIDDRKLGLGEFTRDFVHCRPLCEANTQYRVAAMLCHFSDRLLPLGSVGHFEVFVVHSGLFFKLFDSVVNPLVERLVKASSHIEDHRRFEVRCTRN